MKVLSIIGARPQFVKAAVFRKYCTEGGVDEILLHTGQHYDPEMSTQIFEDLGVREPDISFSLVQRSHGGMTGEMLAGIEQAIIEQKPDYVNVYGDTNSTLAGALAASKLHVPVVHIESGLRSFNKRMPEEINRILTDHVSRYLFCPTFEAVDNLKKENIVEGVHHVGDIMHDAVRVFQDKFKFPSRVKLKGNKKLAVMTVHRAETTSDDERLKAIVRYCRRYSDDYQVVFPVHPHTSNKLREFQVSVDGLDLIAPVSYLEMQGLLREAELVLTDSGGLQKEAYFHKCPCITLRDETEWRETIGAGWNRLWRQDDWALPRSNIADYGNAETAQRIIEILEGGK